MQELQEMQVQSLDREDPLEEETATHPSIQDDRGAQEDYSPKGRKESDMTKLKGMHNNKFWTKGKNLIWLMQYHQGYWAHLGIRITVVSPKVQIYF